MSLKVFLDGISDNQVFKSVVSYGFGDIGKTKWKKNVFRVTGLKILGSLRVGTHVFLKLFFFWKNI